MKGWLQTVAAAALLLSAPALAQNGQTPQNAQTQGEPNSPPATSAKLSSQDQTFLQQSAGAITSKIKLGHLAVDKGSSPTVKQLDSSRSVSFNPLNRILTNWPVI